MLIRVKYAGMVEPTTPEKLEDALAGLSSGLRSEGVADPAIDAIPGQARFEVAFGVEAVDAGAARRSALSSIGRHWCAPERVTLTEVAPEA